jgi:hypothetical protein
MSFPNSSRSSVGTCRTFDRPPTRFSTETSSYWRYPAKLVLAVVTALSVPLLFRLTGVTYAALPAVVQVLLMGVFVTAAVVSLVYAVATQYAFYAESRLLRERNAPWQPVWYVYVLSSVLLSPFGSAVVYLFNRRRHIGVPWNDLLPR